jgi:hypothetical protein
LAASSTRTTPVELSAIKSGIEAWPEKSHVLRVGAEPVREQGDEPNGEAAREQE